MATGRLGPPGLHVLAHVMVVRKGDTDHVQAHHPLDWGERVLETPTKRQYAINCGAQVSCTCKIPFKMFISP